jgi:hypothetical protein
MLSQDGHQDDTHVEREIAVNDTHSSRESELLREMSALRVSHSEHTALKIALAEFDDPDARPRDPEDPLIHPQSIRTKMVDGLVEGWGPAAHRVSPQLRARFPDIDDDGFWKIADAALPLTALSVQRLYSIYLTVKYVVEAQIPGDVAECGVFKGGSAIMLAEAFAHFGDTSRRIFLFDTFAGWPAPSVQDTDFVGQDFSAIYASEICQTSATEKKSNPSIFKLENFFVRTRNAILRETRYPVDRIVFVKGLVENTLPHPDLKTLSILRLDTDFYESTEWELNVLWPCLSYGGVMLIDDYGQFYGARKAVDDYLQRHRIPALLHRDDVTGRSMVKVGT